MGLHPASCAGRPASSHDDVPASVLSALLPVGIAVGTALS